MAKQELIMPQMGESITTGTITKWNKAAGDKVEIDEIILEISTDKVESEIPSPFSGRIASLLFEEGETIDVGKVIALIEDDDSAALDTAAPSKKEEASSAKAAPAAAEKKSAAPQASSNSGKSNKFYTPLVRKMAKENGINLVDLDHLEGSGAGGRFNKSDFEKFLKSGGKSSGGSSSRPTPSVTTPAFRPGERVEIIPMDNMRKMIAQNMVASKLTSPHVNSVDEVDMTHLVKFREGFKHQFQKQEGFKLTYTPFIMKAIIDALQEHPYVNASVDGNNIVLKKDINLGCAVAVPGNGLIVPVIKNAESLNMLGICRALQDLATRARAKKLKLEELQGGTFTFSNVGSFGTVLATPIILQPQVGIMAAGVIKKRVAVMPDDSIGIRSMMFLTHSYDHRLVDGELGGKFLASVRNNLHNMDTDEMF